jgi:hypothetical protein
LQKLRLPVGSDCQAVDLMASFDFDERNAERGVS